MDLWEEIGAPIATEKTEYAERMIIFLGILLDGKDMVLRIPIKKREKALKMLNFTDSKKATVKELQELCGYLNFLCKAIFPGRLFIQRMYSKYSHIVQIQGTRRTNS